jgi:aryl-alcohol dehydrogenase-like predicted oxidoreductase
MDVALQAVPSGHFETVQFPFNFITCEAADELIPLAQEHDVGFIAVKPFLGVVARFAPLVYSCVRSVVVNGSWWSR